MPSHLLLSSRFIWPVMRETERDFPSRHCVTLILLPAYVISGPWFTLVHPAICFLWSVTPAASGIARLLWMNARRSRAWPVSCCLQCSWCVDKVKVLVWIINEWFTTTYQWLLFVRPGFTSRNSEFYSHNVFMSCMDLRTNNDYFPLQHLFIFYVFIEIVGMLTESFAHSTLCFPVPFRFWRRSSASQQMLPVYLFSLITHCAVKMGSNPM